MTTPGGSLKAAAGAAALVLALAPVAGLAQSANDWRLPGATVRPAPPGSQGPVDRDNPVVTTTVPRPTQTATPPPTPASTATPPAPAATTAPTAMPTRPPAPRPAATAPRQTGPATATPAAASSPASGDAAATPTLGAPAAVPSDFAATPVPAPAPAAVPEQAAAAGWYWPWIAGAAAVLALLFAGLWWRRSRQPQVVQVEFERPQVPPAAPQPEPRAVTTPPVSRPEPAPPPLPEPQLSIALPGGLGMVLEARRMSASLMATTLSYAIRLTNTGTEPLSALAVEGDMISAHASLPPEAQIANDNQRLELRHNLIELAPGESAEFTGDFRLPLTAVTPIRAGDAAYFIPLARLRIEASTPGGQSLVHAQTFVVGELPDDPAAALKPFRLDLGPRTYSRIGQRAVN